MLISKEFSSKNEESLRMYYSSGYYSLDEFLETAFAQNPKLFERNPEKAYIGRTISKDPSNRDDIVDAKQRLLQFAGSQLIEPDPVYIEFGVRAGISMATVSKAIAGEEASLFGLDTFTGLPDGWVAMWGNRGDSTINKPRMPGEMAVQNVPTFEDNRVILIKGLFQDTLPVVLPKLGKRRLFINIDGDTYTAALFALFMLHPYLKIGDLIYFDEFVDELNEFAAFNDYVRSCYVKDRFRLIGRAFDGMLFRFE